MSFLRFSSCVNFNNIILSDVLSVNEPGLVGTVRRNMVLGSMCHRQFLYMYSRKVRNMYCLHGSIGSRARVIMHRGGMVGSV